MPRTSAPASTSARWRRSRQRLEPLQRSTCPFAEKPELNGPTTWVEPEIVAEVSFQSWTEDDAPARAGVPAAARRRRSEGRAPRRARRRAAARRHPSAAGPIDEIVAQLANTKTAFTLAVGPHRIRLTHLDRVYWPADPALKQPALTKRDLLRYFAQVSPYILPHLADRPLTMIRMPDGIRGQRFFQKHWEQERPDFVETITVFSGHKDEQPRVPAVQQPADAAVARAVRHARIPRLAFAREARTRRGIEEHRLRDLARVAGGLGAQLSRLRAVRHRSLHLFRQGSARRGTRAQHGRLREGQGGGVLAARAAAEHVAGGRSSRPRARPACTCSCRSGARSISTPRATCRSWSAGT